MPSYDEGMAQVRVSESEAVRDMAAVLDRVRRGDEVVIENNLEPVAVVQPPLPAGRTIDDAIAWLKIHGTNAIPDADYARDVQAAVDAHRESLNPPEWD